MHNVDEKKVEQGISQFQNRLKNRFIIEGSSLLGNKMEHSNLFEKDTESSKGFTIIKIKFERATLREASSFKSFLDKKHKELKYNIVLK